MSTIIGEDAETQKLSVVFTSLGKCGKEGEKWQQHTENVLFYGLKQASELLYKSCGHRITFQPTGSAAEDFKNVEPNDVGDVDVIIFPNSDDLMINDELIEYLPNNPGYVRIKGADHLLLQSCLVEGRVCSQFSLKEFPPSDLLREFLILENMPKLWTMLHSS